MATVLLIDADQDVRFVLKRTLETGGHTVVVALPGDQLRTQLEAVTYDVVVTDLHLPGMDGWAVAKWMAEHRSETPVIAVGGDFDPPTSMEMFAVSLMKPFRRVDLLAAVAWAVTVKEERH